MTEGAELRLRSLGGYTESDVPKGTLRAVLSQLLD